MASVKPSEALGLGIYHFHPRWTVNYGDSMEKRIEEFEDVVKSGYFNSIIVEKEYLNNDEFWRVCLENGCTVWLNIYDSFYSDKWTFEEWSAPYVKELDILKQNPERWENYLGLHFDEPVWRGQSNADFLYMTKTFYEMYGKRNFPVFACGEFTDNEGNSMQLKMEAKDMKKVIPEALKYVTDVGFDSYSVDVREGWGNGSYINKMHEKYGDDIVDGKSYYKKHTDILLSMIDHDVNIWYFPTCYTTGLWRGGRVGEGFCIGHLEYMAELLMQQKCQGGLCLYTYYQFSNPAEFGLQSHLVVKDAEGNLKLRPENVKWWDYSAKLREMCEKFKNTKANLAEFKG